MVIKDGDERDDDAVGVGKVVNAVNAGVVDVVGEFGDVGDDVDGYNDSNGNDADVDDVEMKVNYVVRNMVNFTGNHDGNRNRYNHSLKAC